MLIKIKSRDSHINEDHGFEFAFKSLIIIKLLHSYLVIILFGLLFREIFIHLRLIGLLSNPYSTTVLISVPLRKPFIVVKNLCSIISYIELSRNASDKIFIHLSFLYEANPSLLIQTKQSCSKEYLLIYFLCIPAM